MKHKTWGDLVHSAEDGTSDTDQQSAEMRRREQAQHTQRRLHRLRKNNIIHTRFLVAASFVCGMVISQRGPSILDLGDVTHASLQSSASLFALGALGQMIGCVGAGLLLGRLHSSIFLFWALLGMCGSTAALPWCRQYGLQAAVYCFSLLCLGCVETGSYAEIAKRWGSEGGHKIQLLQLWFVVGGVISPGMTQFFLAPRYRHHHTSVDNTTTSTASTSTWRTVAATNTLESTSDSWNESRRIGETDSQVQMAYGVTGALAFFVSMPFLMSFVVRKELPQSPATGKQTTPVSSHNMQAQDTNKSVLLLIAVFIFLVCAVEDSMHQFLFTFMIQEAGWTAHAAAWVTTWFWSGVLLVRAVAYFFPGQVMDEAILALSCALLPCTLAGLHASVVFFNNDGVWACVFFAGMSVSLIFPVAFTWMHTCLAQRSSVVSGVVMFSSLVAGIVNPLLLGYFLHSGRYEGFTFLLLAEAVLGLLVFLVLYVLSRKLNARWLSMATRKSILVPGKLEEVHDEDDV